MCLCHMLLLLGFAALGAGSPTPSMCSTNGRSFSCCWVVACGPTAWQWYKHSGCIALPTHIVAYCRLCYTVSTPACPRLGGAPHAHAQLAFLVESIKDAVGEARLGAPSLPRHLRRYSCMGGGAQQRSSAAMGALWCHTACMLACVRAFACVHACVRAVCRWQAAQMRLLNLPKGRALQQAAVVVSAAPCGWDNAANPPPLAAASYCHLTATPRLPGAPQATGDTSRSAAQTCGWRPLRPLRPRRPAKAEGLLVAEVVAAEQEQEQEQT